jgi:ABC-type Fe3+-siderophore transport system permease subunit
VLRAAVETSRRLVLSVAVLSTATFVALVLTLGRELLACQVSTAVVVDAIWVTVFGVYLVGTKERAT